MRALRTVLLICSGMAVLGGTPAFAEMLAFVVYETRSEESLRALKLKVKPTPIENGVAIIDLDPASPNYKKILAKYPFIPGTSPHHQYYNPDKTKLYVTSTVAQVIHVFDLMRKPYGVKRIEAPGCKH